MTAIWFLLAAACLAGAAFLLWADRRRKELTGKARQVWAKSRNYSFKVSDATLPQQWRRATLAKQGYLSAVDIVTGSRRGVRFTLFDLEDSATIVAVQRRVGSNVDIDLRLRTAPTPKDPDLELMGSMGERVVFATDTEIAARVCDERMAALAEILPDNLQVLWSENTWTLGSLPITATPRDWDQAIDGVIRFSGLLHVLPPNDRHWDDAAALGPRAVPDLVEEEQDEDDAEDSADTDYFEEAEHEPEQPVHSSDWREDTQAWSAPQSHDVDAADPDDEEDHGHEMAEQPVSASNKPDGGSFHPGFRGLRDYRPKGFKTE